jgi:cytochrome c5
MAAPDMDKYAKSCQVCHANGAANAPITGDAAAWEPRCRPRVCALTAPTRITRP